MGWDALIKPGTLQKKLHHLNFAWQLILEQFGTVKKRRRNRPYHQKSPSPSNIESLKQTKNCMHLNFKLLTTLQQQQR